MPRCLSLSDYLYLLIFLFSLYLTLSLSVALSVWLCLSLFFVSFYPYISLSPCFCPSLPNIPIFCLNPTVSCLSLSFVALCLPLSLSISVSVYFCVSPSVFVCLCLSVFQSLPSVIFPFSLLPIFSWQTHLHFQFLLLRHSWTPKSDHRVEVTEQISVETNFTTRRTKFRQSRLAPPHDENTHQSSLA